MLMDLKPYDPSEIGARLIKLRAAEGLNQKQFAQAIGVSPSRLANWEKGDHAPKAAEAAAIKAKFNITLDWLYLGDDDELPTRVSIKLGLVDHV